MPTEAQLHAYLYGGVPIGTPIHVIHHNTSSSSTRNSSAARQSNHMTAREKRIKEYQNFSGWSNNSAVRRLQEESLQIYIDTGRWDTSRQKELHEEAEDIRHSENPMYSGSKYGPSNAGQANSIFLPDVSSGLGELAGSAGAAANKFAIFGIFALIILFLKG